jgi:trans-aconitate methyltransferase
MSTARSKAPDAWDSGQAYERYVGRWSRQVAVQFLEWLQPQQRAVWADVGCGTGALTSTVLAHCDPTAVRGVDSSAQFLEQARQRVEDSRVDFEIGDATRLPWNDGSFDVTVSGLVLNFVADHQAMVREMARVTKRNGTVALYVWDYADGMQMMRVFWDAAAEVHPEGAQFDESRRFPICNPDALGALFTSAGLTQVQTRPIEIDTHFADFDDYWSPFLGKTGAAPAYLATLLEPLRLQIRELLASRLHASADGKIEMTARAWAVRGVIADQNA